MLNVQWEEIARRGKNHALLLIDQVAQSYSRGLLGPTLDSELTIQHYRQLAGARWLSVNDVENYVQAMQAGLEKDPKMMLHIAKQRNSIVAKIRDLGYMDIDSSDSEQRRKNILNFLEFGVQLWATAYHYIILNKFYPDLLVARVAEKESNYLKQNAYLATLLELPQATDARLEKNSMLNIALTAKEKSEWRTSREVNELINEHLQKFAHMGLHYYWGAPYAPKDIYPRLEVLLSKNLGDELNSKQLQENVNLTTAEIFDKLKFGEEEKILVETLRQWGQTANYADETYSFAVYKLMPSIKQTCKEWNISWNQFASMRVSEIKNAFENGFDDNLITQLSSRYIDHAIIFDNPTVTVLYGEQLKKYKKIELAEQEAMHSVKQLQGQSVCPGLVAGKTRIVQSLEDANALQRGEILVAPSTFPAYVPAMERSVAIVTDEGGLLCHAAIVAREIKVPCIVGTKIATKVFRNGDEVEVNATNGTIKKI